MQQITITGYLSRDAEGRKTAKGTDITNLNIPVKQGWGDKEQTNWFRVAVWGNRAEFAGKFRKGEFVCVTGELSIGEYDGKPQYEINASDFHSVRPAPRDERGESKRPYDDGHQSGGNSSFATDSLDDDIGF